MADFWIVHRYFYKRWSSLEKAEEAKAVLEAQFPENKFWVMRGKTGLRADPEQHHRMVEIMRSLAGSGKFSDLRVSAKAWISEMDERERAAEEARALAESTKTFGRRKKPESQCL